MTSTNDLPLTGLKDAVKAATDDLMHRRDAVIRNAYDDGRGMTMYHIATLTGYNKERIRQICKEETPAG